MSNPKNPTAVLLTGHSVTVIAALATIGIVTVAAAVGSAAVIGFVKYQEKKLKKNTK